MNLFGRGNKQPGLNTPEAARSIDTRNLEWGQQLLVLFADTTHFNDPFLKGVVDDAILQGATTPEGTIPIEYPVFHDFAGVSIADPNECQKAGLGLAHVGITLQKRDPSNTLHVTKVSRVRTYDKDHRSGPSNGAASIRLSALESAFAGLTVEESPDGNGAKVQLLSTPPAHQRQNNGTLSPVLTHHENVVLRSRVPVPDNEDGEHLTALLGENLSAIGIFANGVNLFRDDS